LLHSDILNSFFFYVHGSVHRKTILVYIQQDAALHSLVYLKSALHISGGTGISVEFGKAGRNTVLNMLWF